jgi:hypothetical protein
MYHHRCQHYFLYRNIRYFSIIILGVAYVACSGGTSATILNLGAPLLTNIVSDYVALFIVKRYIVLGKTNTLKALLLGPLIGMVVIMLFFAVRYFVILILAVFALPGDHLARFLNFFYLPDLYINSVGAARPFSLAALVVHLWLPSFGFCVVVLKILNYFRFAVGGTQWFLSRGSAHPLEAIGYVATVVVFATTIAVQHIF